MMKRPSFAFSAVALAAALAAGSAGAQTVSGVAFVNGLAIPGDTPDRSGAAGVDGRLGFFSDLYYDASRNEWWGVSDRGPGGGTLGYETRIQRFTLDVAANGAISNFQVAQTLRFRNAGAALNGLAPNPSSVLGNSFDPEGMVVNPRTGNLLVSDEYGPSLLEIDRNSGQLVKRYAVPDNLLPRAGAAVDYNAAPPTLTSGREPNRGFEGLAVSPDGRYAYAVLQNGAVQDGWSSAGRGQYTRIVQFDTDSGNAVGQYALRLDSAAQGRGVSAIVALGNDKFMLIERNNRGVGVGATLAAPDKNVVLVDLAGATDASAVALPASGGLPAGTVAATKGAKVIDLDADRLAALGGLAPEKWEGLTVGPRLASGRYLLLAGTDNDYSVTQNGTGTQFDVWFDFSAADPYAASIQCPVGSVADCTFTTGGGAAALTGAYKLLPGVLHAYTADLAGYLAPVPEPGTWALTLAGLLLIGGAAQRRKA